MGKMKDFFTSIMEENLPDPWDQYFLELEREYLHHQEHHDMQAKKIHVRLTSDESGEGVKWGLFREGDAEPFAHLTESPETFVIDMVKRANKD